MCLLWIETAIDFYYEMNPFTRATTVQVPLSVCGHSYLYKIYTTSPFYVVVD
jgi:hypothetical protein